MSDNPPASAPRTASRYVDEVAQLLFDQFVEVIRVHQPELEPALRGEHVGTIVRKDESS